MSQLGILCVDDEPQVLQALRRVLRRLDATLHTASSGAEALTILSRHHINVVVSDMRMPKMSGAELFARIEKRSPGIFKIMLTGFADLSCAIKAINEGKVDKFFEKPWNNSQLLEAIRLGGETSLLNRRVSDAQSPTPLPHTTGNLHRVLFNLQAAHPCLSVAIAKQRARLMRNLSLKLGHDAGTRQQLTLAGLLCEVGMLNLPHALLSKPIATLSNTERTLFFNQCDTASDILQPAPNLRLARDLIAHQYARFDGAGYLPKNHQGQTVANVGILPVCRDFYRHLNGQITGHIMSQTESLHALAEKSGADYDAKYVELLREYLRNEAIGDEPIRLDLLRFNEGMTLARELRAPDGRLLLCSGHTLTSSSIEALHKFSRAHKFPIQALVFEIQNC